LGVEPDRDGVGSDVAHFNRVTVGNGAHGSDGARRAPSPRIILDNNCCPSVRDMCSPTTRAETSVPPPGANGTIIVIVRVG
jgi:hypothetical protein